MGGDKLGPEKDQGSVIVAAKATFIRESTDEQVIKKKEKEYSSIAILVPGAVRPGKKEFGEALETCKERRPHT